MTVTTRPPILKNQTTLWIAGAGLAGTLLALELERLKWPFEIWDVGSGQRTSRVAAGILNPLLGPRMTADPGDWNHLEPFYRQLEERLEASFYHPLTIERPWQESLVSPLDFPRQGPGWSATVHGPWIQIQGGGWVDIPVLLDRSRQRWQRQGLLHETMLEPEHAIGKVVIWCGGIADFTSSAWHDEAGVKNQWQSVRGEILTIKAPDCPQTNLYIGKRFLLPLGNQLFRWGATHQPDDLSMEERPSLRQQLMEELQSWPGLGPFEVIQHQWGLRPSTRHFRPFIQAHSQQPGWWLFNGFAGKGLSTIPRSLPTLLAQWS